MGAGTAVAVISRVSVGARMAAACVGIAIVGVAAIVAGLEQARVANRMATPISESRAVCSGFIKACALTVGALASTW